MEGYKRTWDVCERPFHHLRRPLPCGFAAA